MAASGSWAESFPPPSRSLPKPNASSTSAYRGPDHWFGSAFKTASKKRKLTPTACPDAVTTPYNAPESSLRDHHLQGSPHLSPPRPGPNASTASHLPSDQQLAGTSVSPSPASVAHISRSTAVSGTSVDSPSEAYAGLTLDSVETPLDTAGMNQGREDPLAFVSDDEQIADTAEPDTQREIRSSSPAKRRASAMDDGHTDDRLQSSQAHDINTSEQQPPTPSSSKASSKQHTREASVDMLIATNGNNGAVSTDPSSVSETPADQEMEDAADVPSIDDQVNAIMKELTSQAKDGDVGYLVAVAWINRVLARSSQKDDHGPFDKEILEGDVGPIDNTSILPPQLSEDLFDDNGEKYIQTKPGLTVNTEVEVFTEKAFELAVKWYGLAPGQVPIKRYAHATNADGFDQNVQFEMYPPIFTLRKLQAERSSFDKHATEDGKQKAPRIVASRSCVFQKFLKRAKESTGVPMGTKVKLWRVLNPEAVATDTKAKGANGNVLLSPPESREASPSVQSTSVSLLIKSEAFKAMPEAVEKEMIEMKDETNNDKFNGRAQLGTLGLAADQVLILEEQNSSGSFSSDATKKTAKTSKKGGLLSGTSSGRSSPLLGPITRGRNRASGRTQGSVGLTNLGNTCYMNSALQCIRATEELTCFFLSKSWKKELNKGNPLGHEGKMATTYASLLDSVYDTNSSSFTPSDFKRMLSKCGPQFSGYGQQDSQEFMSFLVDALHEDMNRILKKPYIENPDSDDSRVHDEEYIKELGNIFRENYRKRNDSVIHDLFNGFYKNTMVCPHCDKVSVTFDPYLLLTLQLPLEHSWQHAVYLVPLQGQPVKVEIDMDKHSTIAQLKQYVATKVPGLDAKRLMMAEVFSKKFYRTVEDKQTIAEANIQARDEMYLYELDEAPTNFPPPKKKKKYKSMLSFGLDDDEEADIPGDESPLADVMMVPIFQRAPGQSYSTSMNLANTPFFITVNRDEARSYTEIYRKVLARIASLTSRDFLNEFSMESADSIVDDEQERVGDEDGDADVQTRSVESEDGVVEVSVSKSGVNGDTKGTAPQASKSVLEPGVPIPEVLLELFELKVMEKQSEMVPTGFHAIQESRKFKLLSSRLPKLSRQPSVDNETPASSESSDVDEVTPSVQPTLTDGGDSEEEGSVSQKSKKLKIYNKKFSGNQNGQSSTASTDEEGSIDFDATTDEPILHLGECLIVDWNRQNFDALFEGREEDDMRGRETLGKHTPLLEDKELSEKRKRRTERKKNGISLDECFQVTARGEILTEDNAWYCNRCKELRQAEKTLEIWTAPDILVIHLKRFSAARQFRDKIDILVDFPTEGLDLNDKVGLQEGSDLTYDLFAVDNHYGGLGGGHYTAYAKNFVDREWYEYNDSSVSKRSATSVVTSAAYLLFYRRRSSQYLGSPDLRQLVASFRNPEEEGVTDSAAEDGDLESRATSPSGQGKGHRLGEKTSFHNGLSSVSAAGQGASRLHRRGGDGLAADQGALVKSGGLPGLDGYDGDDDEGYGGGMDEDPDDALPPASAFIGPHRPPPSYQEAAPYSAYQPWSFAGVPETNQAGGESDLAEADADSIAPMGDGEEDMRLLEDFGDELGQNIDSAHNNSPVMRSTETEMDYMGDHMEDVQRYEDVGDPDPVDIHVDSPPASAAHEKNE